jgi:four helix bundle protein
MPPLSKSEDIEAWRKARELASLVYSYTKVEAFTRDIALRDHARRSAISALAHIAEGGDRDNRPQAGGLLTAARVAVAEVEAQMYVAADQGYITERQLQSLLAISSDVKRACSSLARLMRESADSGAPRPSDGARPGTGGSRHGADRRPGR